VAQPCAGRLAAARNVESLVMALKDLLADYPVRSETRRYAERFGWGEATQAQLELFARISRRKEVV
jgi:hypothetical protein